MAKNLDDADATLDVGDLAKVANIEFGDVADFIWKAPRLLESERKVEIGKLEAYFPNDERMQNLRWKNESRKLDGTFPFMLSMGNLFGALSVLEAYLLRLAHAVRRVTDGDFRDVRGQGVRKWLEFLRLSGIKASDQELCAQIDAALKIRHCLMHATGILSVSRDANELRQVVRSRLFLSEDHRRMRSGNSAGLSDEDEVSIVATAFGDRLVIRNDYAWLIAIYSRDFFVGLCDTASDALRLTDAQKGVEPEQNRSGSADNLGGRETGADGDFSLA